MLLRGQADAAGQSPLPAQTADSRVDLGLAALDAWLKPKFKRHVDARVTLALRQVVFGQGLADGGNPS